MTFKKREFKSDLKSQRTYAIFAIIVFIPFILLSINGIIDSNKELKTYNGVPRITSTDKINSREVTQVISYQHDRRRLNLSILSLSILIGILAYLLYSVLFKDTKLIIDKNSIRVYSFYSDKPSIKVLWDDIKSIQFGFMYVQNSRVTQYRMKMIYKKNKNSMRLSNEFIKVRKYEKDKELINAIETLGKMYSIDVFHMNE